MRYTPTDITSTYAAITALNVNFDDIQTLLEKCVFTDGTPPNAMEADFDMNHFNIKNVADAINPTDAINLEQATSLIGGVTLSGDSFSSRALMALATSPVLNQIAVLGEKGREGNFVVDLASNWTAAIAADTAQGLFVPSTADPTKVYVRKFGNAPYNPTWWGMVVGDTSGNAAANTAAFSAMLTTLAAISTTTGFGRIRLPQGIVWMGDNGAGAAIDIQNGPCVLEGHGQPRAGGGAAGTLIKLSGAITGVRIQSGDTSGATGTGASQPGGEYSLVRDFGVLGNYTTVESEAHGLHVRGTVFIKNVTVSQMPGDGFHVNANDAAGQGNANCFRIEDCVAGNNRNNFYMDGGDANAGTVSGCIATGARQWDYWDSSFLGNAFISCLAESFTTPAGGSPNAGVSVSGHQYRVIPGQEAGASTNAPSGTATDNTWWFYVQDGGVTTTYPAWVSGTTYRAGGTYHNDNLNQKNAAYIGCYDESNGSISWLGNPAMVIGGFLSDDINESATNGWGPAGYLNSNNTVGTPKSRGLELIPTYNATAIQVGLCGGLGGLDDGIIRFSHPTVAPSCYTYCIDTEFGSNTLALFDDGGGFLPVYQITLPGSTAQFGTGAAQKNRFWPGNLVVGSSLTNARLLSNASAAPNATAAGQFYFNSSPTATGPFGWLAFSGSAATPVPATPVYSGLGTNPIGYTTGAGGTVTQLTSKSTAVTLNTLCGEITMEATTSLAANGATAFALNNSQIGAHDSIVLTRGDSLSASSNYILGARINGAGVASISVRNMTGAALAEAVVIRFAIIKTVNA